MTVSVCVGVWVCASLCVVFGCVKCQCSVWVGGISVYICVCISDARVQVWVGPSVYICLCISDGRV